MIFYDEISISVPGNSTSPLPLCWDAEGLGASGGGCPRHPQRRGPNSGGGKQHERDYDSTSDQGLVCPEWKQTSLKKILTAKCILVCF